MTGMQQRVIESGRAGVRAAHMANHFGWVRGREWTAAHHAIAYRVMARGSERAERAKLALERRYGMADDVAWSVIHDGAER